MKEEILKIITETHPYSYKEVERVFDCCESYDWTIKALELATANADDPIIQLAKLGFKLKH